MKTPDLNLRDGPRHLASLVAPILMVCSLSVSANDPPEAKFSVNPDRGPAPLDVTLNASASVDSDGRIEHYNW